MTTDPQAMTPNEAFFFRLIDDLDNAMAIADALGFDTRPFEAAKLEAQAVLAYIQQEKVPPA